jgi:NAD(P)-dependent dehydrogenase (short-subunit alcohol dehydrogenase family)
MTLPLQDRIAVVAGATRGAGRGIARMLGEAGATVYCSGRSVAGQPATGTRPETIEQTAEMVTAAGGRGIAVQTDHLQADQVERLFARVKEESGRVDVLVNDIWGGDALTEWGTPFWKLDPAKGFAILDSAIRTHILTSRYGVPMMIEQRSGLVVEITDGDHPGYRGVLYYDLAKMSAIRLAFAMSEELAGKGVTALAVTPGFLRSEAMLDRLGVTEANWRDAAANVQGFEASETPCFVGRAVAALAADPEVHRKAGGAYASWTLSDEYGFTDVDGARPHWERYMLRRTDEILDRGGPATPQEQFWIKAMYGMFKRDPRYTAMKARIDAVVGTPASDYDPRA